MTALAVGIAYVTGRFIPFTSETDLREIGCENLNYGAG